jgi:O-antigen ligase
MKGKLLFCLIPLGMGFFPSFPDRLNRLLWALFSLCQTVVAVLSLYFYFQDFSQLNEAIGRNTTIDIIGRMSHIYFGFLLAFSVLVCGYMAWRFRPIWRNWERYVWMGIGLLNLLALHVLTSRTGLLVFYGGLVTVLLWPGRKGLQKGLLIAIIAVLISLPILSYQLLPSFRQRVDVSWYDLQQYQEGDENIGDYSLAMRLVAWETGYQIFRAHPLLGVGPGDLETEMIRSAPQSFPVEKLLKNPHNQYIETAAAFGIMGLLLLLWVMLYPLKQSWLQHLPLQITFLTMIAIGMLFESLFERQVGICLYSYFVYLLPNFHLSAPKEHSP